MRKIEQEMINAIRAMRHNNSDASWSKANSAVTNRNTAAGNETSVYLHGHHIATIAGNGSLSVNLCGWNSRTTRARLTLLMNELRRPARYDFGIGIATKAGKVYAHDARGKTEISEMGWHNVILSD